MIKRSRTLRQQTALGFTPSARPIRPYQADTSPRFTRYTKSGINELKKTQWKKIGKDLLINSVKKGLEKAATQDDPFSSQHNKTTAVNNKLNQNLSSNTKAESKMMFDIIKTIATSVLTSASVKNSTKTVKMANNIETRKIHKTVFETGQRTSRAILNAAKQNGTVFSVLYDTKIEVRDPNERAQLTFGAGFNSKMVHFPRSEMHLNNRMIFDVLTRGNASGLDITRFDAATRSLASVMKTKNQFMFHNNSAYLPATVKAVFFKVVGDLDQATSLHTVFRESTMSQTRLDAIDAKNVAGEVVVQADQDSGRVPWYYTHRAANFIDIGNPVGTYLNAEFSLKGRGFLDSTLFKQKFEVIESFEKTLEPGDYWNFSHVHHFGNGIDENIFFRNGVTEVYTGRNNLSDPFTYGVWFETRGKLVEGISVDANGVQSVYQGSSPTYISYENRSSIYYVKENERNFDFTNPTAGQNEAVHRRRYLSDQRGLNWQLGANRRGKEIFATANRVTSTPTNGNFFIPVVSDATIGIDRKPHNAD